MDRIMKAQKADVLTQFSEMKKEKGRKEERKRIASILSQNDEWCCGYALDKENGCHIGCTTCWFEYLEPK